MARTKLLRNIDLEQLDEKEWESLCNHCGVCCLHKVVDVDSGDIYTTNVVCEFYDINSGRCSVYHHRFKVNPGCTKITPDNIGVLSWLPNCCNYRRIFEKSPLLKTDFFKSCLTIRLIFFTSSPKNIHLFNLYINFKPGKCVTSLMNTTLSVYQIFLESCS